MTDDVQPLLHLTAELAGEFLASGPERRITRPVTPQQLRESLGGDLADDGEDPRAVVEALAAGADPGLVVTNAGRFFGFVEGGVLPAALAADWLTSTWDQNPGFYVLSPAAAVVEEICAGWLVDLLGLPDGTSTGFTTGAQMANLAGLAAARHHVLAAVGWDAEGDGLGGAPPVTVVVGEERHATVGRALRFLGLGERRVTVVAADGQGRMRAGGVREALAAAPGPAIVVAQAGNVNTGAFDPLREICEAAGEHGAWVHVDGAFGMWAAAAPSLRHLTDGIELADSWATDGHKWLNVPYDSGIVFCAHPDSHAAAMSLSAAYLVRQGDLRNGTDWTPESSRRARGFAIWAALRSLGRRGVADLVERCCASARAFAEILSAEPDVAILNDVVLNQVLVRVGDDDARTQAVVAAVQGDGSTWLGGTTWHDLAAVRISVSDQATDADDVRQAADAILAAVAATRV